MSNDLMTVLSSGKALAKGGALDKLREISKKASGGGTRRRISIKGNKFRQMVGGEQVSVFKGEAMNIIVVNMSEVSRMYYEGNYDPKGSGQRPTCWSDDSNSGVPSENVPDDQKQASSCNECPMNIKGSGQGQSRACRYSQRLAVLVEGDWKNIYQLSLPAASLFGDPVGGDMPFGAYARMLNANEVPIGAVVTEMSFDEDSEVPKLFFKPIRILEEDELEQVTALTDRPDTIDCITLSVGAMDGVSSSEKEESEKPAPKPKPKPKAKRKVRAKPAPAPEPEEAEEEIPEPTKKDSGAPDVEPSDSNLDDILDDWDDEDDDEDDEG